MFVTISPFQAVVTMLMKPFLSGVSDSVKMARLLRCVTYMVIPKDGPPPRWGGWPRVDEMPGHTWDHVTGVIFMRAGSALIQVPGA